MAGPLAPSESAVEGIPAAGQRSASQQRPLWDREGEEGRPRGGQVEEGHGAGGELAAGLGRGAGGGLEEGRGGGGGGVDGRGAGSRGGGGGGGGRRGGEGQTERLLHPPQEGDGDTGATRGLVVTVMVVGGVGVVMVGVVGGPESFLHGALAGQLGGLAE